MTLTQLRKLALSATMLAPLAIGGFAPSAAQAGTQLKSTPSILRIAVHVGLETLDPITTTAYIDRTHGYLVYDTLFAMDKNFQPKPQMVDHWTVSPDQKTWTFVLRDGLKWSDGTDVTAADCVASLERWGKRDGTGQQLFEDIASLTAPDSKTIEMQLKAPDDTVLDALAKLSSNVPFMMPERIAETSPYKSITDPTGSGPYMFVMKDWVPGAKAVYVKNPYYKPRSDPPSLAAGAKIAHADEIELIHYADPKAAAKALIDGYVQYDESPPMSVVPMLEADQNIIVEPTAPPGAVGMLRFNAAIPPFNNPAIRRAVLEAIDQTAYMEAAFGVDPRWWHTCYSIYPCGTTYATDAGNWIMKLANPQAARYALENAGYKGTPVVVLDPVDIPVLADFTNVTVKMLKDIGMTVKVENMTWEEMLKRRNNRGTTNGWNVFDTWWIADDISSPQAIAYSGDPKTGWAGWPDDPKLEKDRMAFAVATTLADQQATAAQVQEDVLHDATVGILGQFFEPIAFSKNLTGLTTPVQFFWNLQP
jgi:peptide/nickel transport system substrate-binding protein